MTEAAIAIAKLLLSAYFSFAKLQGASEEELNALYSSAKDEFDKNDPNALEKV